MSSSNNSGNSAGGTITGTGANGNITWIPTTPQYITITVPTSTQQQYTITGIDWGDLAVPVEKKNKSDGCSCKKCKEFFEYAEPNQEDGTLICWACRHGY